MWQAKFVETHLVHMKDPDAAAQVLQALFLED
jgi:hypothetical protein